MTLPDRQTVIAMVFALGLGSPATAAEDAVIAVAANFSEVMGKLIETFEQDTPYRIRTTSASTGILYAQIRNGAPFDVLLAADQRRPQLLVTEGAAVDGSRFTYAIGRLSLWSPDPEMVDGAATLERAEFDKLAIANPDLAPYGFAAMETIGNLNLAAQLDSKLVMGTSIGQTHAMVATGSAALGFVALSYLKSSRNASPGSRWDVPAELHSPIRQDAVLLKRAAGNKAAMAFLAFMKGEKAAGVLLSRGYEVPSTQTKRQEN